MDSRTKLARKMKRNPAAILEDDEVEALVMEADLLLGAEFSRLLAARPGRFAELVRWSSVKARCEQAREDRRIDIKTAAKQAGIARYRVIAIESGTIAGLVPELAWQYFDFLGIRVWVNKWIRSNVDLATRLGILPGRPKPSGGGRKSNKRVQQTVRPVTSVAGQRPRQAVPQLTLERYAS